MSSTQVAWLGAIAGSTIFLGLPIGRVRTGVVGMRAVLNAVAIGVLVFLLWDVLSHAWEPVDAALAGHDVGTAAGYGTVLVVGIGVGLLGLVAFDRWTADRATAAEPSSVEEHWWSRPSSRLSLLIAVGIGLHNFAEGLAIGNSAAVGELSLAWVLVIGFATHNATEGFGIVAPLTADGVRPSWWQLGVLGLIGGGPTLLGTVLGQRFTSELAGVAFLAVAAGSILYVIIELLAVARRFTLKYHTTWGLFAGLVLGFATDAVLTVAGA